MQSSSAMYLERMDRMSPLEKIKAKPFDFGLAVLLDTLILIVALTTLWAMVSAAFHPIENLPPRVEMNS